MYSLGQYIGNGGYSIFFKIREHPELGIKIRIDDFGSEKNLHQELEKARILKKLGVPVPRYTDVIDIQIPLTIEFTLEKNNDIPKNLTYKFIRSAGNIVKGLVIEKIDSDIIMVKSKRAQFLYEKEIKNIAALGIKIADDVSLRNNILWSASRSKIYFIDFDFWEFPEKLIPPKNKKGLSGIFSRIFR